MKQNKDFWESEKARFIYWFALIFFGTFLVLYFIGFVPDEISLDGESALNDLKLQTLESVSEPAPKQQEALQIIGEIPLHIYVPKVGIDISVQDPQSTDNAVLNEYLTRGAVHYPGSAELGAGNVFIFGHSSNWAVVNNKAYKALNGIDKLVRGDLIYVDSDSHRYVYEVTNVRVASASESYVDFSNNKNMLTLSTCDIFGQEQNRWVAEALFVRKENL